MPGVKVNKYIDHTLLKPEAKEIDIVKLCQEAKEYGFKAVCVNPYYINLASKLLTGTSVKIATVVGFPLGANTTSIKVLEAEEAFKAGAHEVDMVINIGALKSGKEKIVKNDIKAVVNIAKSLVSPKIVKVIIETALLTEEEKVKACQIVLESGADFIKTSTGFNGKGATIEDIKLMKGIVGEKVQIKASGGIRDYNTAVALIKAGANRIGTSSGVKIVGGINDGHQDTGSRA